MASPTTWAALLQVQLISYQSQSGDIAGFIEQPEWYEID
jgi:hypothetical protein